MIDSNAKVCVVYLAWLPYGMQHFRNFIGSYCRHEAGHPHDLVIAFNGLALPHQDGPEAYLQYMKEAGVSVFRTVNFSKGQDIEIYSQMAGNLHHDFILYLNTYSVLLTDQWLKLYVQGWEAGRGVLSATGSWQSYYSSVFGLNKWMWEKGESFTNFIRKIKLMIKAGLYWRFLFDKFPNHHVRTNAFFTERALFEKVTRGLRIHSKFDAYLFESGKRGMTRMIESMGRTVAIVDRFGQVYDQQEWPQARVFRIGHQENLLVSDNQTNEYELAQDEQRQLLTRLTWGNHG